MKQKQKQECSTIVYRGRFGQGGNCSKPVQVVRNGKPYCSMHDPVRVQQKKMVAQEVYRVAQEARDKFHADKQKRYAATVKAFELLQDVKAGKYDGSGEMPYLRRRAVRILNMLPKEDENAR